MSGPAQRLQRTLRWKSRMESIEESGARNEFVCWVWHRLFWKVKFAFAIWLEII